MVGTPSATSHPGVALGPWDPRRFTSEAGTQLNQDPAGSLQLRPQKTKVRDAKDLLVCHGPSLRNMLFNLASFFLCSKAAELFTL